MFFTDQMGTGHPGRGSHDQKSQKSTQRSGLRLDGKNSLGPHGNSDSQQGIGHVLAFEVSSSESFRRLWNMEDVCAKQPPIWAYAAHYDLEVHNVATYEEGAGGKRRHGATPGQTRGYYRDRARRARESDLRKDAIVFENSFRSILASKERKNSFERSGCWEIRQTLCWCV